MKTNLVNNLYKLSMAAAFVFCSNILVAQQKMGDNLGTHKASKDLDMNSRDVNNVKVLNSQGVVIGTAAAIDNSSIALQVNGADKAILISRVTDLLNTTNPSIVNPVDGMIVYDILTRKFYVRNDEKWITFATTDLGDGEILLGDVSGKAQKVKIFGDLTLKNTGEAVIGDGKVTTAKIAADAVTASRIKDAEVLASKLSLTTTDGSADLNEKVLTTDANGNNIWKPLSSFTSNTLSDGKILIGGTDNLAKAVTPSGDVSITTAGVITIGDNKVTTAKILNGNVTTDKLANASVTTDKLNDLSVINAKLAADAVTTDKIKDGEVETADIAALAVTDAKLAANAVTTVKILDANVTAGKLAAAPSGGDLFNKVLTTDATGNNTWADKTKVTLPAMTDKQVIVSNGTTPTAVTMNGDITIDNTGATLIGADKVTTAKILNANVTNAKLAADAVTTDKIKDGEVNTADIAALAVTDTKIAGGAVLTAKLADNAVTTAKILDANVTAGKLAAAPSGGDLFNKVLTTDATGNNTWADKTKVTLPAMTDKQVIVSNGTTPAAVTMSGDITIDNTGATAIGADKVTTAKILNANVTNAKLAADAVTTDKIKDGEVNTADIAALAVTDAKLAANAVTTVKILDANVTAGKLAAAPSGGDLFNKVLTTDATGNNTWADKTKVTLPAMTDKQVIVSNGTTPTAVTMSGDITIDNTGATAIGADKVTTAKILNANVTNAKLAADAVTTAKILDANVTNAKLAADAVTTDKIKDGEVNTADIAALAVTDAKLAANAVTTAKILDANVTAGKLAAAPSGGDLFNKVLTTDATGNNTWADKTKVTLPAMTDKQVIVSNGTTPTSVTMSGDITIDNTGATAIGADKVTTAKILNANVTNAKLAADAVTTVKILDANVTNAKLAADAVTTDKIKDGEVGTADIAALAVTDAKLAANAVTTAKILDANVTAGKLAAAPSGGDLFNKVLTTDATGNNTWADKTKVTLPAMTDKQVIVSNGTTPTAVTMSGDITIDNTGATSIGADKVTTAKILNANVTNAKLAADAVTTDKIKDGEVNTADIAALAVTDAKLAANAVTTAKILDANVTAGKLAAAPSGGDLFNKVLTTDAAGNNTWADKTKVTLPAMTDKQVIVSNGTTPTAVTMSGDITIDNTGATAIGADKVTTAKILNANVTNAKLAADAVTTDKIKDGEVGTADIAALAVTDAKIAGGAVLTAKLADNAVTTVKILDANVTAGKLAAAPSGGDLFNKVLTTDATGNNTWADKTKVTLPAMTDKQVIVSNGTTPAAVTMSGDITIDNTGATLIGADKVTTAKILDANVTNAKLAADAVTTDKIKDGEVNTADIAALAVTDAKLAANSVTTVKILDANVTAGKLAAAPSGGDLFNKVLTTDATGNNTWADKTKVTLPAMTDKQVIVSNGTTPTAVTMSGDITIDNTGATAIGADKVTTAKILNANVTNAKLAADAVTTDKIKDGEVKGIDIASDASVDANRAIATNHIKDKAITVNKINNGTANQVLVTNAAGTGVEWISAFGQFVDLTTDQAAINGQKTFISDKGFAATGTYVGAAATIDPPVTAATATASGMSDRMMWYPAKAAFRAGFASPTLQLPVYTAPASPVYTTDGSNNITYNTGTSVTVPTGQHWDKDYIGIFSTAFGTNTLASAHASFATGNRAKATGENSFAIGRATLASNLNSVAYGGETEASNYEALAGGLRTKASGLRSVAFGFESEAKGDQAMAFGTNAKAAHHGTFALGTDVIAGGFRSTAIGFNITNNYEGTMALADNQAANLLIGRPNQLVTRFKEYVFYTNTVGAQSAWLGAKMTEGNTSWSAASDKRLKENFLEVDAEHFLSKIDTMQLSSWNYKNTNAKTMRHYGPMAQDFYGAFGKDAMGTIGNDTLINSADFDGVNMIAIQGLIKRTNTLKAEKDALKAQVDKLTAQNESLNKTLQQQQGSIDALAALKAEMDEQKLLMNARMKQLEEMMQKAAAGVTASSDSQNKVSQK